MINNFDIREFLPFRLKVLADTVSESIGQLYSNRFDLSRSDWRVLSTLGDKPNISSKQIAQYGMLDKMQVSRTVKRLETKNLLNRADDPLDKRNKIVSLTPSGQSMLEEIIPLVNARENYLIDALTDAELKQYFIFSDKILERAKHLVKNG